MTLAAFRGGEEALHKVTKEVEKGKPGIALKEFLQRRDHSRLIAAMGVAVATA
jgi:hypothetical protein